MDTNNKPVVKSDDETIQNTKQLYEQGKITYDVMVSKVMEYITSGRDNRRML